VPHDAVPVREPGNAAQLVHGARRYHWLPHGQRGKRPSSRLRTAGAALLPCQHGNPAE
jgi:hypothetical protein